MREQRIRQTNYNGYVIEYFEDGRWILERTTTKRALGEEHEQQLTLDL